MNSQTADSSTEALNEMGKQVKEIMQKPPGQRSPEDCLIIVKWLTRTEREHSPDDRRCFTLAPLKVLLELAQQITINGYEAGEVIFLQKEAGVTYFVVVEGCVDIYDVDIPRQIPEDLNQQYMDIKFQAELNGEKKMPEKNPDAPCRIIGNLVQKGKYLASVTAGCSLGDIALSSNEGARTASAVAVQQTHLIAIHKTIFDPLLRKYSILNKEFEKRMEFCSHIDILSDWGRDRLCHIAYWLEEAEYPKGSYIISQSRPTAPDQLDFVKEGEVEVVCRLGLKTIELAIRGTANIIGEGCVLNEKSVNFSVIAKSDVKTYCLKEAHIKQFLKICKGTNTIPKLHKLFTDREAFRQARINHFTQHADLVDNLLHPSPIKTRRPMRLTPIRHPSLSPTQKILNVYISYYIYYL